LEDHPIAVADVGDESGSNSEAEVPTAASAKSGPSHPSKKKKKRSKVSRAVSALKGGSVPQAVVDQVVAKVREEHGEDSPAVDEETVCQLLKQLKLKDMAEGKAGLGGKYRKDVTDLQGPPSECTQTEKLKDLKTLAQQYARDWGSCDDTRISYLEFVELEAEADLTLARMISG
jgi:hypothetical protein